MRNRLSALDRSSGSVNCSNRNTVSGDKRPCAVWKEGSVSHEASTDGERESGDVLDPLLLFGDNTPGVASIF